MTDIGLPYLRRQTEAFINLDPTVISLIPVGRTVSPGGGVSKIGAQPKPPQTLKLIWQGGNPSGKVQASDGSDRQYDMVLLGPHDADFDIGDHWFHDGVKYVIEGFLPDSEYQRKVGVKAYGEKPYGG